MSETMMRESAIYHGQVFHHRFVPKRHQFSYKVFLYWLKLNEISDLASSIKGFSDTEGGISVVRFKRSDYLGDPQVKLEEAVKNRMLELGAQDVSGDVFFLGQLRTFGWYFSPVNFYYLRNSNGHFTYLLAEVSNTPWNQRHHYLVDLEKQADAPKAFHVSPFNPMDMQYQWHIQAPGEQLKLHLSCKQTRKHFHAALNMRRQTFSNRNFRRALLGIPSMTLKTVAGIYWQATKLFVKGVPFYSHQ